MNPTFSTKFRSATQTTLQLFSTLSLLTFIGYYLRYFLCTILAVTCNKSFIIRHPARTYPTLISSPWKITIHSFAPQDVMLTQCHLPFPPLERIWSHPQNLPQRMIGNKKLTQAIILDGLLIGPPLTQGMAVVVEDDIIYIHEELGRWPTREDYVVTHSISIHSGNTFRLFIPTHYLSPYNLRDESTPSPLRSPLTISEAIYFRRTRKHSSFPPISEV